MLLDASHSGTQVLARPSFEISDLPLSPDCRNIQDARCDEWVFQTARMLLAEPCDQAITGILELTGLAAGADRAWMFEYDATLLRFRNTHEWSRETVTSHVTDLQDTPVTMIAWLQQFLSANQAVMINNVSTLPRPARDLQAEMLRQNDKSVLCIPVFFEDRLRACIGFDATRTHALGWRSHITALPLREPDCACALWQQHPRSTKQTTGCPPVGRSVDLYPHLWSGPGCNIG